MNKQRVVTIIREARHVPDFSVLKAGDFGVKGFEKLFSETMNLTIRLNGLTLHHHYMVWWQIPSLVGYDLYREILKAYQSDNPIGGIQGIYDHLKKEVDTLVDAVIARKNELGAV